MEKINDRCSRIAELLLIENEIKKIESNTSFINISEVYENTFETCMLKFTPIEKIMYSILLRIESDFAYSYQGLYLSIQCQQKIGNYRVDFLVTSSFSDEKIIIECDGHDFHEKTKEQAKHDKERDRYLTSNGYKILRYTGSELYNNFNEIENELSSLLDVPTTKSLFKGKTQ